VQREILQRHQTSNIRVYAVWVPFLAGTQQAADVSQRVLPDPRVVHYWDGEATTSDWFAENVEHSFAPAWDVYYLYGPDATWQEVPGPLVSSGATIIGSSSELNDAITPLFQDLRSSAA
jgi:hypothetical protein